MADKYGYIGIETLLNYCSNSKDHAITPNEILRLKREKIQFSKVAILIENEWIQRRVPSWRDIYLDEQTMMIYVPFISYEYIVDNGGTIERL